LRKNESLHLYALFGRGSVFIPKNGADRDSQAIDAVKAALGNAKANLIECEFPVLEQLNKLGDGSLRSAKIAEEANLNFVAKLVKSLKPIPLIGPPLLLLSSSSSSNSFSASVQDVASKLGVGFLSLREGDISEKLDGKTVLVFVNPSSSTDYNLARKASSKTKTLLINGFAKNDKSVSGEAVMAYFLKPLTYNSQVIAYLLRKWPGNWQTIDANTKKLLLESDDRTILVPGTNTPDLRSSVRAAQKSFDQRAIDSRKQKR